jgi:hypothetical protein
MDSESVERHKKALLHVLPVLSGYISAFASINKRWGAAITAGMIEAGRMDQGAAALFNPLIQDMGSTKEKFRVIQDRLITAILHEIVKKVVLELSEAATFAINILKRNLYERTADVGYLATDAVLQALMAMPADDPGLEDAAERMRVRLDEYRKEYTVYDEIIALDLDGRVRVHLDQASPISASADPLVRRTLAVDLGAAGDKYLETFRNTDLRPGKGNALIYSQTIPDADCRRPLGVLCLCFDFEDEMSRVFADLAKGNGAVTVCILDEAGRVIASADQAVAPLGANMPMVLDRDCDIVTLGGRQYLATTERTAGYQGFYGLTWYGHALVELEKAFTPDNGDKSAGNGVATELESFSAELAGIQRESDDILADMTLDSLNGQVKAAKYKADGFVEVLRFVNSIGREIGRMFEESIAGLESTILSSTTHGLQFRAFRANNIADRNLYERANDVCWWALTPLFREALARNHAGGLDEAGRKALREELREDLQYINDLYTPYLRIVLADVHGTVVAVSDPPAGLDDRCAGDSCPHGQDFVGQKLPAELVQRALRLSCPGDYAVSPFEPTPLYGGRPTYVYATAVRDPENDARVVGVIEIVFDAEPQLAAMLEGVLPRDERKAILQGCFALLAERTGKVVASAGDWPEEARTIALPREFTALEPGQRSWCTMELSGRRHLAGCQVSAGYREYKISDGYANDLLCLVCLPI